MRREDFYEVDDLDALRMENDLLVLEIRLLRGRTEEHARELRAARDEAARALTKARSTLPEREVVRRVATAVKAERDRILTQVAEDNDERRRRFRSVPHEEFERMRKAESDLQWLIHRIESSPLAMVFRRLGGWRELVDRHGRQPDAG